MTKSSRWAVFVLFLSAISFVIFYSCVAEASATPAYLRNQSEPYEVQVLVNGSAVPTYQYRGETYALGVNGDRYTLRVINRSGRRVEAVVSVDGRDVIDGKTGDYRRKRGYLVGPWGSIDIDGFRVSTSQAAAFRFSSVADSYAARTGSARNVGVIGVAVFPERQAPRPQPAYVPYRRGDSYGYGARPGEASRERRAERPTTSAGSLGRAAGRASDSEKGAARAPMPSADAIPSVAESKAQSYEDTTRPGLGTEFGEAVVSPIRHVSFARANASHPDAVLGLRYNDRAGLVAIGIPVDWPYEPENAVRRTANPFPENGNYATPPAGWREY